VVAFAPMFVPTAICAGGSFLLQRRIAAAA
jgi:hypothetical protein